jgi:hypothetical protein
MNCQHQNKSVSLCETGPHYGKELCAICGKFLRWLPKPETAMRNAKHIEMLQDLACVKLPPWEREFTEGLREDGALKKLSPKQQALLVEIHFKWVRF